MAEARKGFLGRFLAADRETTEPEAPPQAAEKAEESASSGWWGRLTSGLSRSSRSLTSGIADIFTKRRLDRAALDELEELLIKADLGVETAARIADALARERLDKSVTPEEVREVLAAEVEKTLAPVAKPLELNAEHRPFVILVVGVNGTGKTTTIGKLAARFRAAGTSVTLAAGDTFRAAAIEQLKIWGERVGAPVVARAQGSDAAGLAFDAMAEAKATGSDVLLIDTAGRLQNKAELMAELSKVVRVIKKQDATAPHAVLLTLDATTGQNALNQVEVFRDEVGVTGLVMTKLDGTARGGILVAIAEKTGLPVHFIGVGEGVEDLAPFSARDFARAIAGAA
jgi:fused signal recognition particle receptor